MSQQENREKLCLFLTLGTWNTLAVAGYETSTLHLRSEESTAGFKDE